MYQTPHTINDNHVYGIQSSVRSDALTGCPEYSWLSWDDAACQSALDTGDVKAFGKIDQVSGAERKLWKFTKMKEALQMCYFFFIHPYVADGSPSVCIDN